MNQSRVCLITGGSRGIGAAAAKLLAESGYRVVASFKQNEDAAQEVKAEVEQAGGQMSILQADVGQEDSVLALFSRVDKDFGRLDALVNNAGILERQCGIEDLTAERLERIFRINVIGTFLCCREAAKRMQRGASIVNVSSVASRLGAPHEYVDYAASKGAVDSLTIGLAKELSGRGIRVNAVRPGFIDTDIHADGGEAGRVARVGPGLPLGRGGTALEVARAIRWLLSDESSFTTGDFIEVAGGK